MSWAVIGVPIDSARSGGTELALARCASTASWSRSVPTDGGDLDVSVRGEERDAATGVIGIDGVIATTTAVRAAVADAIGAGTRPLLLGGAGSLVPGALAGLRDAAGEHGVAYVDGHVDVYDGWASPPARPPTCRWPSRSASARSPWTDAAGGPTTAPEDVIVFGARDPEEAEDIHDLLTGPLSPLTVPRPRRPRRRAGAGPEAVLDPPRRRRARRARDARDRLPDARRARRGMSSRRSWRRSAHHRRWPASASAAAPGEASGRHRPLAHRHAARGLARTRLSQHQRRPGIGLKSPPPDTYVAGNQPQPL